MQELITYIIITITVGYVAFSIVKMFVRKEATSSCASSGCSGCSIQSSCGGDLKIDGIKN